LEEIAMTEKRTPEEIVKEIMDLSEPERDKGNGHAKGQPRFLLKPFEAITLSTAPNYLVKGILPRHGLAVVWGPPKCGKSFWTFGHAYRARLGIPRPARATRRDRLFRVGR
jgi:hypothetical protein